VKLAKKMKKNDVNVDFIAFGDLDQANIDKLRAFHENVNKGDGSHLEVVQPGPSLLSDHLVASPILAGEGAAPRGGEDVGGGADQSSFEFGVDPSADPELALALRMSMEEEKARQDKENKSKETDKMEGIPEEGGESQPLLDDKGEASGSGSGSKNDKKDEDGDDKMDTA
jgi:26S proteasome regulatory subunit N10